VVGISDGDTLSVLREGKAVKVRLHGVDTPEKAQAFGTQARKCTSDFAFQQTVTVVVQPTVRYGRLVGEVLLPDGRSLNQELVRAGMAWWYRQYAPHDTTLAQLEAEAQVAKRGLGGDAAPSATVGVAEGATRGLASRCSPSIDRIFRHRSGHRSSPQQALSLARLS
jgi:micrococcal nuclease